MTTYLFALSLIVTSVVFFTSQTEQSRVVTIQRPIMITQERKTPAYFVYQQAQKLQQKKIESKNTPSTYLSSLSLSPPQVTIQTAEMKINKKEWQAKSAPTNVQVAMIVKPAIDVPKTLTYQQVFGTSAPIEPAPEQPNQATSLSPSKKWATIRGKFELIEGVGIVNHYIELKRVEEGQIREVGHIDLKAGVYTIEIESPNGYLIAQIKDQNGSLVGEDRERLINLQSRGAFFEGPFIRVGRPETIAANPALGTSYDSSSRLAALGKSNKTATASQGISVSLFDNQNVLVKPYDVFTNISKYSTTISRVFDPSRIYRDIVSLRQTGDKTETAMFTTKWLSGVTEYISDVQKIEFMTKNGPVIIGRVLVDGKAVANAQVQIDSLAGVAPIYFDQFMIPSFSQDGTSENGYFMFLGLEPNNYHIVASKQNVALGSQLFVAENEMVGFQNISGLSAPRFKLIRTFDAFTSGVISTDISTAEFEEAIENVAGTVSFKTYVESSLGEFLARAAGSRIYVPVRYVQNTKQEYVHIPMIQENWLLAVRNHNKIEEKENVGTIIGFVTDLTYDAYLVSDDYNKNDIVFFNSLGHIVGEPTVGGGFILFNVPTGTRELILQEKNSDRIYSQVFNVLDQQVSVSHFSGD